MFTASFALLFALLGLPLILLDVVWASRRASRLRRDACEQRAMLAFDRAEGKLWALVADKALPTVPKQFAVEVLRGFRDAAVFVTFAPTLVTLGLMARVLDKYDVSDPRAQRFLDLLNDGIRQRVSETSVTRRLLRYLLFRSHRDEEDKFRLHYYHTGFRVDPELERERDVIAR